MPRAYKMVKRAASSAGTSDRILDCARNLFLERGFDDVTLQTTADKAGVALRTVLRHWGSKEELLLACVQRGGAAESELRRVPAGDVRAVARVLAGRYEGTMDGMARYWPLEDRIPAVATALAAARAAHRAWLAEVFASHLPARKGALRERRLTELFWATELWVWHCLRRRFGLDAAAAEQAMAETLEALVSHWSGR